MTAFNKTVVLRTVRLLQAVAPPLWVTEAFATRLLSMLWILSLGAVVTSFVSFASYLVYSGAALEWFGRVMLNACVVAGNCGNFPAMLSGLTTGLMMLTIIGLIMFVGFWPMKRDEALPDYEQVSLLIDWYRSTPRERTWLLDMLERSDADPDVKALKMLRDETRELEAMEHGNH
jgi:hypothetical protein